MLEKLFSVTPDWIKSKLMVRIIYTAGSFVTARCVAFLTGDYLNAVVRLHVKRIGSL